jgi:mono/diheme cytochrome c family protein
MKKRLLLAMVPVGAFVAIGLWIREAHSSFPVQTVVVRDLPAEVLGVFRAKCSGCHGPDLAKPRGRFGYVLDLARLAGDREKIVPGRPAESELWELVDRDEMPPPDSPQGSLTPKQKEIVRDWIAGGARE